MIICIDAGHTPNVDPGACANGLKEVSLTGDICDRIITKLAAYDADVRLVPRTDSLQARCDYANSRITPAYAGNMEGIKVYDNLNKDHPRLRGEHN